MPRCGAEVTESKNGYFCERRSCKFGLWRDNRFPCRQEDQPDKEDGFLASDAGTRLCQRYLLEKTGKTYDAFIVLEDDGARSSYKLDFTK